MIGAELDRYVERECSQNGRLFGQIISMPGIDVFASTWAALIQDCKWRHDFYRRELQIEVLAEDCLSYLQERHAWYLPAALGFANV